MEELEAEAQPRADPESPVRRELLMEALEAEAEMAAEQPGQRDSRHQLATTPSWFKTSFTQPS